MKEMRTCQLIVDGRPFQGHVVSLYKSWEDVNPAHMHDQGIMPGPPDGDILIGTLPDDDDVEALRAISARANVASFDLRIAEPNGLGAGLVTRLHWDGRIKHIVTDDVACSMIFSVAPHGKMVMTCTEEVTV